MFIAGSFDPRNAGVIHQKHRSSNSVSCDDKLSFSRITKDPSAWDRPCDLSYANEGAATVGILIVE